MSFICELDVGHTKVPSDWSKALGLLKKNFVTSMLIKAFAEVTQHQLVIITENGVRNMYACSYQKYNQHSRIMGVFEKFFSIPCCLLCLMQREFEKKIFLDLGGFNALDIRRTRIA